MVPQKYYLEKIQWAELISKGRAENTYYDLANGLVWKI
jgi:hypothetical protein